MNAILIRNFVLFFICGWITYTDLKRHEIDHTPLLIGTLFIIPFNLLGFNTITFSQSLVGCVVLFILFFIMSFFGMGGGDMKLMAMIGLFLGLGQGLTAAIFAIYIAAFIAIFIILIKHKKETLKSKMAMGPSIAIGTICAIYLYPLVLDYLSKNLLTI